MKRLIALAVVIFFTQSIFAQDTIKVDDASKYIGKKVVVCAKVYGVKFLDRSKNQPTFINIGAAYPNSPMTIVIFGKDRGNFSTAPEELYADKDICVTGEVKEYKGKYEIIVEKPESITVESSKE